MFNVDSKAGWSKKNEKQETKTNKCQCPLSSEQVEDPWRQFGRNENDYGEKDLCLQFGGFGLSLRQSIPADCYATQCSTLSCVYSVRLSSVCRPKSVIHECVWNLANRRNFLQFLVLEYLTTKPWIIPHWISVTQSINQSIDQSFICSDRVQSHWWATEQGRELQLQLPLVQT